MRATFPMDSWTHAPMDPDVAVSMDGDVDLLRLGVFAQRQRHRQHAVLVLGGDVGGVDGRRQREGPREAAETPLDAVVLLLLNVLVRLLPAAQRQGVVLDLEADVLPADVGDLGLQDDGLAVVLVDVDRRNPRATRQQVVVRIPAGDVTEHTVHAILEDRQIAKRIESNEAHGDVLLLKPARLKPRPTYSLVTWFLRTRRPRRRHPGPPSVPDRPCLPRPPRLPV